MHEPIEFGWEEAATDDELTKAIVDCNLITGGEELEDLEAFEGRVESGGRLPTADWKQVCTSLKKTKNRSAAG